MAYADLARRTLPENDQLESIAGLVSRTSSSGDGYSGLTECMDRIKATPAERGACVEKAAESRFQHLSVRRKITREDIEQLRGWAGSQSPELTDRATGKALAAALQNKGKADFSEIAGLAVEYHDTSGSDELLVPLLKSWQARKNKEQALELATRISDEAARETILKSLE